MSADIEVAVLHFYRKVQPKVKTALKAAKAVATEYGIDYRTVGRIVKDQEKLEKQRLWNKMIIDAQNENGVDYSSVYPKAYSLFCDSLYEGKKLDGTQVRFIERVLNKVEAAANNKKEKLLDKSPEEAFE